MRRTSSFLPLLALLGGSGQQVHAYFSRFYFNTHPLTPCANARSYATCTAPWGICAHDTATSVDYCCGSQTDSDDDEACSTSEIACDSSGGSTLQCANAAGNMTWCCLGGGRQTCGGMPGLCWSTLPDPVLDVSLAALNATFTALLAAAAPTATTLAFDLAALPTAGPDIVTAIVTSTAGGRTVTVTSTSSGSDGGYPTSYATDPVWPGLTSADRAAMWADIIGTIAGIIMAVVFTIMGIWLCVRSRRRRNRMRRQAEMEGPAGAATAAAGGAAVGAAGTTAAIRGDDGTDDDADEATAGDEMLQEARVVAAEARAKAFGAEYYAPEGMPGATAEGSEEEVAGKGAMTTTRARTTMVGRFA